MWNSFMISVHPCASVVPFSSLVSWGGNDPVGGHVRTRQGSDDKNGKKEADGLHLMATLPYVCIWCTLFCNTQWGFRASGRTGCDEPENLRRARESRESSRIGGTCNISMEAQYWARLPIFICLNLFAFIRWIRGQNPFSRPEGTPSGTAVTGGAGAGLSG